MLSNQIPLLVRIFPHPKQETHIKVDLIHPLHLLQVGEIHSHHLQLQPANLRGLCASLLQHMAALPSSWVFKQSSTPYSFLFFLPSTTTNDNTTL